MALDLFKIVQDSEHEYDYYNDDVSLETASRLAIDEYKKKNLKYTSEHPTNKDDVTDDTFDAMFGRGWDGSFVSLKEPTTVKKESTTEQNYKTNTLNKFSEQNTQTTNQDLTAFPKAVADKFKEVDMVQEMYHMPHKQYLKTQDLDDIFEAIKCPDGLDKSTQSVFDIKSSVNDMSNVESKRDQNRQTIDNMKKSLSNNEYKGVLDNGKNSCKFMEIPSSFAARYPYNRMHETESGHIFEIDNTPGRERLRVKHTSGTDIEVSPNGDTVAKLKNNFQTIVEHDSQHHVKNNHLTVVDNICETECKTLKLTAIEDFNTSATKMICTCDSSSTIADNYLCIAKDTMTLASNASTSVSSSGPLYITSDSQIVIDAPTIIIGSSRTELINMNASTTNVRADTVFISDGLIKLEGFITLN